MSVPKTGDLVLLCWIEGSFTRCVTTALQPGVAQEVPDLTSLHVLNYHLLQEPDERHFALVNHHVLA